MADSSYLNVAALLRPSVNGAVGTFTDPAGNAVTAYGDTSIVSSASMATGHAYQFDGTGDYLRWAGNSNYLINYGAFTIDFEVKTTGSGCIVSTGSNSTVSWSVTVDSSGHVNFLVNGWAYKTGAIAVNDGAKHHISVVRHSSSGATMSLWVDGAQDGATFNYGNSLNVVPDYVAVGANVSWSGSVSQLFVGEIGFVRITKDVARWTSSFTPPTVNDLGFTYSGVSAFDLIVGDSDSGFAVAPVSISEFMEIGDAPAGIWFAALSSMAVVGAAHRATVMAVGRVMADLSVSSIASSRVTFITGLVSTVEMSKAASAKLLSSASIREAIRIYTADLNAGDIDDAIETWCANLATAAHTRYAKYGFNSFAKFGGKPYGCKSDGIYALDGETDGPSPIPWSVTLGETDFGMDALKRLPYVYVGAKSTGDLVLKVIEKAGTVHFFNVEMSSREERAGRAKLARGLSGRYWKIEIASDSERVELDAIEFFPVKVTRRI